MWRRFSGPDHLHPMFVIREALDWVLEFPSNEVGPPRLKGLNNSNMAKKATSLRAAKAASKVLRDGRSSKQSKTAAASALSQREKSKRKK